MSASGKAGSISSSPGARLRSAPLGRTIAPPLGPDHNLWFTEQKAGKIGTITPTGAITEFPVPTAQGPSGAHHRGPRRQSVVHGAYEQQDQPHHADRDGHRISRQQR